METKNTKNKGKVYPFHHSTASILFCVLALLLCAVGIGLSIYRIIITENWDFTQALQSPFLIAICVFCAVVVLSIIVKSEYIVTQTELITRFGFIKSTLLLSTVTAIEHDRTAHKLTLYCGENYTVFTLKQEWADELVRDICQANPDAAFSFTMTENKPPKDEGGKKEKADKNTPKKDD